MQKAAAKEASGTASAATKTKAVVTSAGGSGGDGVVVETPVAVQDLIRILMPVPGTQSRFSTCRRQGGEFRASWETLYSTVLHVALCAVLLMSLGGPLQGSTVQ